MAGLRVRTPRRIFGLRRLPAEPRRQDDTQFGRYRTRDLILAYMNALSAGDVETVVAL